MKVKVKASEVKEGDLLYFPNGRKAQTVQTLEQGAMPNNVVFGAEMARWTCNKENEVYVEREQ